jgi:hypothetical protein
MTTLAHVDALRSLSDRALIAEIHQLAAGERHATARVLAALMEVDARQLYRGEGCRSLFTYCTQVLHFSEYAACGRIEAARAARRFPVLLDHLADGSLTLTTVGLLAAHLTPENHAGLLVAARHQSKRDVELIVRRAATTPRCPRRCESCRRPGGSKARQPSSRAPRQTPRRPRRGSRRRRAQDPNRSVCLSPLSIPRPASFPAENLP